VAEVAERATTKIEAMLPPRPSASVTCNSDDPLDIVRTCIEAECRLHLDYRNAKGRPSARIVWPIELYRYHDSGMIAAWCESRSDFRNFRIDRIQSLHALDRYPMRRETLLAKWQLHEDETRFIDLAAAYDLWTTLITLLFEAQAGECLCHPPSLPAATHSSSFFVSLSS
jgi:predicted DNA-binding transcriptional regulator YafY